MAAAKMSVAELEKFLREEFPQAFSDGDITIESADGQTCLLRRRFDERMLRPGGTVSGPTLMAMADFAMYVVLLSAIGPVGLAVTTNLNINFLRKGMPGQDVLAAARAFEDFRFNGAALLKARKVPPCNGCVRPTTCFNGAALLKARKVFSKGNSFSADRHASTEPRF